MNDLQEPEKPENSTIFGKWWKRVRTIRETPSYAEGLVFGAACIGLVLFVWWLLTVGEGDKRLVDAFTLPSPRETFESFPDLWKRELSRSVLISLIRVLGGFLLAAAIGVPLGVVAGSYLRVNAFFKPLVIFGRSIPIAALIPLTMVWFGLGEFNKVMFIFLATLAFVIFDTVNTVHAVPDRFIDTAYTLGARGSRKKGARLAAFAGVFYGLLIMVGWYLLRDDAARTLATELSCASSWYRFAAGFIVGFALWFPIAGHQILRKVILPLALPDIVNSLRLIFGLAFGYIMLAEVINAKTGIGALIINSQRRGFQEHIYLCLFIITLLAWAIDRAIMLLQRQLFPHIQHGEN
ncbi:MAG: ABC transporter permease subunit [Gloeobacteraceae cyanobacterium ES-bin-144]|nr:ABC transporter permease subunit [Verrucomicrobiales bacterium]